MRLTCPNCDAQYEVDDRAIPESGRDVQCSNCGHAWFQLPPDAEAQLQEAAGQRPPAPEAPAPEAPAAAAAASFAPESFGAEAAEPPEELPETAVPPSERPQGMERRRRELDEDVISVLREEAERESAARRAESGTLETQPELGLEAPGSALPAAEITRRRSPQPEEPAGEDTFEQPPAEQPPAPPEEDETEAEYEPPTGSRRDLLPDIEEINSTLRASSERERGEAGAAPPAEAPAERARGFRLGFGLVLALVALLLLAYAWAPAIVARLPAAGPAMQRYVAAVDHGRLWLDSKMQTAVTALRPDESAKN